MKHLLCLALALPLLAADSNTTLRPWNDYRAIMWVGESAYKKPEKIPLFFQRLKEMGINTAMVHGDGNLKPLLDNKMPYYVENMVNRGLCLKFSSKVTDWNKFVTEWTKNGRSETAFVRDYCFDDPEWRGWARREMQSLVRKNMGNRPFAYDIRDELSTTMSANPFDYDFSPRALAGFRSWLKTQYPTLAALNEEWQTRFATWDDVKPFTTDQIKNRMSSGDAIPQGKPDWQAVQHTKFDPAKAASQPTRWNFAPWCDFRTYMDLSLANMLADLRTAARELDPRTPVGIEGTQMPSAWGGYDLWRLSQALDWVEPYDIGNAREIFGSFMPGKPLMTTVFEKDTDHASRRLWHLLLEGDRGCIIWWSEDCIDWKNEDYALTSKAKALAPVLAEMTSPLGQVLLRAERERDPIYIVYSQPSIQVDWLLESTADGSSWHRRFSSFEASANVSAKRRNGWMKLLQDLGYSPQFLAADKLAEKLPGTGNTAVLVLSDALALSDAQTKAIADWSRTGSHTLLSDAPAGVFDEHGRLRSKPGPLTPATATKQGTMSKLANANNAAQMQAVDMATYPKLRLKNESSPITAWAASDMRVTRDITTPADSCVRTHRFRLGDARLLAFERNIDYHMSEDLKQAGGNEPLEKPLQLTATLNAPQHVYDLHTGKYVGERKEISFTLDPWRPSLFALVPKPITGDIVAHLQGRLP